MLCLGMRKKHELAENCGLLTPLDKKLHENEINSFKAIYEECLKRGHLPFVQKVIMRNFDKIMSES